MISSAPKYSASKKRGRRFADAGSLESLSHDTTGAGGNRRVGCSRLDRCPRRDQLRRHSHNGPAQYVQYCQYSAHDVAIKKFSVPQSARPNQTRRITVGVSNNACPDTVQVTLFRNNVQILGTLTQFVPVRGPNRTTDFAFSYTFTSGDATAKKVTFTAVATIIGAADAFPSDNAATATTKVSK